MKTMSFVLSLVVAALVVGPAYAGDGSHQTKHAKHPAPVSAVSQSTPGTGTGQPAGGTEPALKKSAGTHETTMAHKEDGAGTHGTKKTPRHLRHHQKKAETK
jgi:hypothetical protein